MSYTLDAAAEKAEATLTLTLTQTLIIPGWTPTLLNAFLGRHWGVGHAKKKIDAELIGTYAVAQALTKASGKRRVSLELHGWKRGRLPDPDAVWKSLLDGLVACRLLIDDSPNWCEIVSPVYIRDAIWQTTITLEDL